MFFYTPAHGLRFLFDVSYIVSLPQAMHVIVHMGCVDLKKVAYKCTQWGDWQAAVLRGTVHVWWSFFTSLSPSAHLTELLWQVAR